MLRARITLPAEFQDLDIARLAEAMADLSSAHVALREGTHTGKWNVEWILSKAPDPADLTARLSVQAALYGLDLPSLEWQIEDIPDDIDWLAHSYQQFPPFSVGPFFIYGSHYEGSAPDGQMGLQIDAATAFGSGEHATTKGCLQAMLDLKGRGQCPWNVLDMGTGSGILSIAAWKLWKTPILAVDIDEEAVRVTQRHAQTNGVALSSSALSCAAGDGFKAPLVQKKKPFDLIIANILAGPLIEMSQDLAAVTDKNGYVVLSGMLREQADDVLVSYEALGFVLTERYDIEEWSSLLIHKPAS